jgi:hypothetical protein
MYRPHHMNNAQLEMFEAVFHLGEIERKTVAEIATSLDITPYRVREIRKDPEYQQVRASKRGEMRENAFSLGLNMGEAALDTLYNLLYAKSELVRYHAASKLVDILGLANLHQTAQADEREETKDFLKKITIKRETTVIAEMPPPNPGGLLPDFSASAWQPDFYIDAEPEKSDD